MTQPASDTPSALPAIREQSSGPRAAPRWTARKMAEFLRQLSATHSVSAAAKSVGMSRKSAYRLRSRLKGKAFDLAWDVAFHHSYDNLAHAALERALNGVEIPIFNKGEQVGSYRRFDERLTLALMAQSMHGTPLLGRHAADAERHASRFEALVAEVEAGGGDAPPECPADLPEGRLARVLSLEVSPLSNAALMAALREFYDDPEG
jgi:hypothetical protein